MRAVVEEQEPMTSAELLAAARRGVALAVEEAATRGGLEDAEAFLRSGIEGDLRRQGFGGVDVKLRRPNDLNPLAAFFFIVEAEGLSVRFELEGTRDPLAAIRLHESVLIHADPNHPYVSHGEPLVLESCLARRYFHHAPEGPDFFARLENRTRDPYHFGFESLITNDWVLAADYAFLETGAWGLDEAHRARYGL